MTAVTLTPDEEVPGRAFAHPDHVPADRSVLCVLIRDIAYRLHTGTPLDEWVPDQQRWHRHVMIPRPAAFDGPDELTVVGFFGRRRDDATPDVVRRIMEMSRTLEAALPSVPGVLSYTTSLLVDEVNYANLVLMDRPETIEQWRETAPHPAAAGRLSEQYYSHVRIYQGSIPTAWMSVEDAIRLRSVKYWDFRETPTWTATRLLRR